MDNDSTLPQGTDQAETENQPETENQAGTENNIDTALDTMLERLDINRSYTKIEEDHMRAWLYLMPPDPGDAKYNKQEIKDYLKRSGIVFGYHESNIAAMANKGVYCREIVVAEGRLPDEGQDGYFEYTFEAEVKGPQILEDGTVDYTAANKLVNVRAGDKLATYRPARQGTDGSDIMGNLMKAAVVKELPILRGNGIRRDTDDTYYAEKEGKVELRDGKLDIKSTHEIYGDVDLTIGKVEFFGDIIINGNVLSGVVVRAGRNIEIRGSVEAASLFAGGDIILQRGIQGQQRAKASARGSIFAKFIEQTVVTAGADVVADSIMNSRIVAEGTVRLSGKRGVIVGGYTHGLLGIDTVSVGNDAETRTVIHAGCEADMFDKIAELKKREVQVRRTLDELRETLEDINKKSAVYGEKVQQTMDSSVQKTIYQEKELREELAILISDQQDIQAYIQRGKGAQIRIDGNIFRGTVICVAQLQMPIEKNTSFMNYIAQGGAIVGSVIVH